VARHESTLSSKEQVVMDKHLSESMIQETDSFPSQRQSRYAVGIRVYGARGSKSREWVMGGGQRATTGNRL
jgi:hypothetical protein